MKNVIFDGQYYYVFRALEKCDIEDSVGKIRADSSRVFEENGEFDEYNLDSEITLKEMYEHIRMRYAQNTNCISFTKDASVALTYDMYKKYVMLRFSKEDIENLSVIDASEYFMNETESEIDSVILNIDFDEIYDALEKIENAESLIEIENIFTEYNLGSSNYAVSERQYMDSEEQLRIAKLFAKVKLIEKYDVRDFPDHIIPNVANDRLLRTIGNAYTSTEVVHYKDVPDDKIFNISPIFIHILSMFEQAKQSNDIIAENLIDELNKRIVGFVINGYDFDIENGVLTNGKDIIELNLNKKELELFSNDISLIDDIEDGISINTAFDLDKGNSSYLNTKMQIIAISIMSESIMKKRVFEKALSNIFPNVEFNELLENSYFLSKDLAIKQNGRGYKVSNTVNLIVSQFGKDLDVEATKILINTLSNFSDDELDKIITQGLEYEKIKELLILDKSDDRRKESAKKLEYYAEAIIDNYDWRKKRPLRNSKNQNEREVLKNAIISGVASYEGLENILAVLEENGYSKKEASAIIMNIAIDRKFSEYSYTALLNLSKNELENILMEKEYALQTSVEIVNLDILMGRGKVLRNIKEELISSGISKEFLESKSDKNIAFAYKMVNSYKFDRELSKIEKAAIIRKLLDYYGLNKNESRYLSTVFHKMEDCLNLSKKEIYGVLINSGLNNRILDENGYSLGVMLNSFKKVIPTLKGKEKLLNTEVDEFSIAMASGQISNELKEELNLYGLTDEFINSKKTDAVIVAKKIVDEYEFGYELLDSQKGAIIRAILNDKQLDKGNVGNLRSLYELLNEELNLSSKEISGFIINSAINSNASTIDGLSYSTIIHSPIQTVPKLKEIEKDLITKVYSQTVVKVDENIPDDLRREIIAESGINNIFELAPFRNILAMYEIIHGYNYHRKLSQNDFKNLYQSFLKSKKIQNSTTFADWLIALKEQKMPKQLIYGSLINGAITGRVGLDKEFSILLISPFVSAKRMAENKDQLYSKVDDYLIGIAEIKNSRIGDFFAETLPDDVKKYYDELEVDDSIMTNYPTNLIAVKDIIENCNVGRELQLVEKKKLAEEFLGYKQLYYTTYYSAIKNFTEQLNLQPDEVSAVLINSLKKRLGEFRFGKNPLFILNYKDNPTSVLESIKNGKTKIEPKLDEVNLSIITGIVPEYIKNEITNYGVDNQLLEEKNAKNVVLANNLVNEINKNNKLNDDEKKAIFETVIRFQSLNKKNSGDLNLVFQIMKEKFKLTDQETYIAMLNYAAKTNESEENFAKILNSPGILKNTKLENQDITFTKSVIYRCVSMFPNEETLNMLKDKLIYNGVEKEWLDQKYDSNIIFANYMVQNMNMHREITEKEECAIMKRVLQLSILNKGNRIYLSNSIINCEKNGIEFEDAAKELISIALGRGNFSKNDKKGYSSLIANKNTLINYFNNEYNKDDSLINEQMIKFAVLNCYTEEEKKIVDKKFEEYGFNDEKTEQFKIYMYDLLENRNLGINLSNREKKAIIEHFQKNYNLNVSDFMNIEGVLGENGLDVNRSARALLNLLLDNSLVEEPEYSPSVILKTKSKIFDIFRKGLKTDLNIKEETIDKIVSENLNEEEEKALREEFLKYGINSEFLDRKSKESLYFAKKVFERSSYTNESEKNIKIILFNLLNSSACDKDNDKFSGHIIKRYLKRKIRASENINDIIIRMSFNQNPEIISYSTMMYTPRKILCSKIPNLKEELDFERKTSVLKPNEKILVEEEDIQKAKEQISNYDIDLEKFSYVNDTNFVMIWKMVNEYEFEPKLDREEKKAVFLKILKSRALDSGNRFEKIITKLEKCGFNTQECYGAIINTAIHNSTNKKGLSYSSLLSLKFNDVSKEDFNLNVSQESIKLAKVDEMAENLQEILNIDNSFYDKFMNFCQDKDIRKIEPKSTILTAMYIANNVSSEQELDEAKKLKIAEGLLRDKLIMGKSQVNYLDRIYAALKEKNMSETEICNAMVNLSINQSCLKLGYSYSTLIKNYKKIFELSKEDFDTKPMNIVSIKKIESNYNKENLTEEVKNYAYNYALNLGLPKELLDEKDIRNIVEAINIIKGHNLGREFSTEEEYSILLSLLKSSKTNKGTGYFLGNVISMFSSIGLEPEECYGVIINSAIGKTTPGYSLIQMLTSNKSILKLTKDQVFIQIDEEKLSQHTKKNKYAFELARKSVVVAKQENSLCELDSITDALEELGKENNIR